MVGIVFPDVLEPVDYELLNAFKLLIYLQTERKDYFTNHD
jgi:hypothetical protein